MVEASRVDENVKECSNPWIKSIRLGLDFLRAKLLVDHFVLHSVTHGGL